LTIEPLPDTDWVARSLEGLAPVFAGRFIVHGSHHETACRPAASPWRSPPEPLSAPATMPPRAAACWLPTLLKRRRPRRILDLGCGTGVLAIAAAKAARAPTLARRHRRRSGAGHAPKRAPQWRFNLVRAALALPAMGGIGRRRGASI
jgi:SAM-dependent methyltransferase